MKYLDRTFTVGPAAKQMPGTCERCVWGEAGPHAATCPWRTVLVEGNALRLMFFDPEKWRGRNLRISGVDFESKTVILSDHATDLSQSGSQGVIYSLEIPVAGE